MLAIQKDFFSRAVRHPTLHLSLNRWRTVMQVLFKSRHVQATNLPTNLRDLTEGRARQRFIDHTR
jgi:hypothetical protein